MKKRTEILMISLVLTGAASLAALTSNDGTERSESPARAEAPAAQPEQRGNPVVYDTDIPAETLSDS